MSELHLPWLELSVLLPLVGAVCVSLLKNRDRARMVCTILCAITLALTIGEWFDFAMLGSFEAHDHWDLFQTIFHRDVFVVDELSAPLLPLGALLYLATVMTTLRTKSHRFSFHWTLVSESILLATLACRHPWLIIALLAIATIPPWWELRQRKQCTRVYVIHMTLFVALLVVGQALADWATTSALFSIIAGGLLTAGALLRSGVCPLHCWMTDLFEKATFGTALLFVTPMTGVYAVMRLVFPIAPSWALQSIAILSLVTAVYAAGMALVQRDSRRFFCYLFLSHSSLVLVGLEMATPIGLAGALCVWLSVGISLLGFGLALRSVEARTGRITLDTFHGLYEHTPFLAAMFLLTGLASIGFPGTVGFIGTELLVEGAVEIYPLVGLAVVVAAAMNGVAVVKAYFHVFTGTRHSSTVKMDCRPAERITILVMVVLIVGGGLNPQPGVQSRYHAARALLEHRSVEQPNSSDQTDRTLSPQTARTSDKSNRKWKR
ncbi:proton-conducting transporter transmembrane domain-containing protein [Thalassoroseus pseudoceratinae]|uniref:proton-conducting transporter transmembrane domain-containing protein n=1 Tax=Thalassoroseus pseudoceratinae TaxID=2713176 RepID=UPI001421321E|nr:proton-conducting transporter membrane subunit [Thalassoroseus pseudoceratinae]